MTNLIVGVVELTMNGGKLTKPTQARCKFVIGEDKANRFSQFSSAGRAIVL